MSGRTLMLVHVSPWTVGCGQARPQPFEFKQSRLSSFSWGARFARRESMVLLLVLWFLLPVPASSSSCFC